jgi:hypothetical protein
MPFPQQTGSIQAFQLDRVAYIDIFDGFLLPHSYGHVTIGDTLLTFFHKLPTKHCKQNLLIKLQILFSTTRGHMNIADRYLLCPSSTFVFLAACRAACHFDLTACGLSTSIVMESNPRYLLASSFLDPLYLLSGASVRKRVISARNKTSQANHHCPFKDRYVSSSC